MKLTLIIFLLGAFLMAVMSAALPTELSTNDNNTTTLSAAADPKPNPVPTLNNTNSPPRDRGPMSLSSLAPSVSPDVLRFLFNTTSSVIESSLVQESERENRCWWGSPYGCSRNWCWKTCGTPGSWCWTKRPTYNFEWSRCNSWTDCNVWDECGGACSC